MQELSSKQLTFKFQSRGRLTCKHGNWRFVIKEHHINEFQSAGYDVTAYLVGNSKPLCTESIGSFYDALESLDTFLFEADEAAVRLCAQTQDRLFPADEEYDKEMRERFYKTTKESVRA